MTVNQARRRKALARWHRRLALIVALWLAVLAVSGVLINHANDWGLDHKPLPAPMQQWLYGIESDSEDFCKTAVSLGSDCKHIFARMPLLAGDLLLSENSLFLLDDTGQLIEKLGIGQLGLERLQGAFREGPRIYLRDRHITVLTDTDLLDREILDSELAAALDNRNWLLAGESPNLVSWERLLLDLHAARFLGPLAIVFSDLMAALIILLLLSGLWLYSVKSKANENGSRNQGGHFDQ